MFEAIAEFFRALIDSIATLPATIVRELQSIDLNPFGQTGFIRWLLIVGVVVLVAILTYRSRDNR